jgi:hypothetical protein
VSAAHLHIGDPTRVGVPDDPPAPFAGGLMVGLPDETSLKTLLALTII